MKSFDSVELWKMGMETETVILVGFGDLIVDYVRAELVDLLEEEDTWNAFFPANVSPVSIFFCRGDPVLRVRT